MAVAWTSISNAQVAAGAALTTALVTALRDNVEGIAQRASGAPKIFGVPYNIQVFTANGTWNKPGNYETNDRIYVQVVGGGGSGSVNAGSAYGGGGGGGIVKRFESDSGFGATEAVVIGAGGAPQTGSGVGNAGGASTFGTSGNENYVRANGGAGAPISGTLGALGGTVLMVNTTTPSFPSNSVNTTFFNGGTGGINGSTFSGGPANYGGGGGGGSSGVAQGKGGISAHSGNGGRGESDNVSNGQAGFFPGGGGGGADSTGDSGAGANGIIRVWCVKES